tara:strand:+ start:140 stop:709 length:570 start_codon:yes stop_codon:yes gene_type:complete
MKFNHQFSTLFGGTLLKNENLNLYIDHINNSSNYNNGINQGKLSYDEDLLSKDIFKKLKLKILKEGRNYLNELGHTFQDIQFSCSWATIVDKDNKLPLHYHANSYFSGVFYLNKGEDISFTDPIFDLWHYSNNPNPNIFKITPKPGLLIFFPSFLKHEVATSKEDNRLSIAFNIIPKGKFGWHASSIKL